MKRETRPRFGYKGTSSALNGLTNWIYNERCKYEIKDRGNTDTIYENHKKDIVRYGVENIPNFVKKGHTSFLADKVATKIQKNDKFNDFKEWYKNNILLTYVEPVPITSVTPLTNGVENLGK